MRLSYLVCSLAMLLDVSPVTALAGELPQGLLSFKLGERLGALRDDSVAPPISLATMPTTVPAYLAPPLAAYYDKVDQSRPWPPGERRDTPGTLAISTLDGIIYNIEYRLNKTAWDVPLAVAEASFLRVYGPPTTPPKPVKRWTTPFQGNPQSSQKWEWITKDTVLTIGGQCAFDIVCEYHASLTSVPWGQRARSIIEQRQKDAATRSKQQHEEEIKARERLLR